MTEHLFIKLKKDGKTVGYLELRIRTSHGYPVLWFKNLGHLDEGREWHSGNNIQADSIHPFVTKDKNGKDVFADDEVLVYKGKKNIGEGYVFFNERFLWWTVNNSSQDNDREPPGDWSQLNLCDVDIELIEEKDND